MIVTLAGHVDHGKTSLVRALTGVVTDTLAEEQRRGLTIDLGFAYTREGTRTLGFVDVPGHHRFIANMVAGVAAHQFALLVVAADDGPMPQSREHLAILRLNGVTRGLVALTKADRVDSARLDRARTEIADLVHGTFLEGMPVIATSIEAGDGLPELRTALMEADRQHPHAETGRAFRLAIDRAFTVAGAGAVVTGTVHSGAVELDQELHVFPAGSTARVRGLHVQNRPATRATAGDRCAVNLAGVTLGLLHRGAWLLECPVVPRHHYALRVEVLADFPRSVRHWMPVHAYHATTHTTGRVALLAPGPLQPGTTAVVELVTDAPLVARQADHVVLRDQSLDRTLGGGRIVTVLDPASRRRRDPARLAPIEAFAASTNAGEVLARLLTERPVDRADFQEITVLTDAAMAQLVAKAGVIEADGWLISTSTWTRWQNELVDFTRAHLAAHPAAPGVRANEYRVDVPDRFRAALFGALVAARRLAITAGAFHPPEHTQRLDPADQRLLERITPLLDAEQPPSAGDLAKILHIPLARLDADLRRLTGHGALVQIADKRYYLPRRLAPLARCASELAARGPFSAREFRDAAGVGRNVAIDVLEFFDRRGFTRRNGDVRTVVGERPV